MRHQSGGNRVTSRQERAGSRILDDEGLRGDLADDEYQPILDWAIGVTDALAESTSHQHDDAADSVLDAGIQAIREVVYMVQEVIAKHAEREAADRRDALHVIGNLWTRDNPLKLEKAALKEIHRKLGALADRLDAKLDIAGAEVAGEIATVLSARPGEQARPSHQEPPR